MERYLSLSFSRCFWGFVFILFLFFPFTQTLPVTFTNSDLYEQGIVQRDKGIWRAALDLWQAAKDSLSKANSSDPRIGIAFIELATQKKASDFYEQACEMYFWGFSKVNHEFSKEIEAEIARISPLLDKKEAADWQSLLKRDTPKLIQKINAFWVRKDPMPTTEMNERLIEHWERIAYSKENFKNEPTTIYGTDDRGFVFVKYGEPDKKLAGKLGTNQMEIMRWFPSEFLLRQEIQRYNNNPEVEIWTYSGLKKDAATVFLFGKKSGFGKYGIRYGVEDFIPNRAFRRSGTRMTQGIMPGAFIQLMYYSELFSADSFFMDRFRELEALWGNARAAGDLSPNRDVLLGLMGHYRSIDQDNVEFKHLPLDRTAVFEGVEPLDLNYMTFRYIDSENQPNFLIMAASTNKNVDKDFRPVFFKQAQKTKYKFRHVLLRYNENLTVQEKVVDYPALRNHNTSIFDSLIIKQGDQYRLVAEKIILDVRKAKLEKADISDTAKVIGMSSVFLNELVPLSLNRSELEVSDLIVGVQTPQRLAQAMDYRFPVIPKDPVKKSDSLSIYIELYNMSDEIRSLRFDCELRMIKDGKVAKEKKLSQSFQGDASGKRSEKTFSLDISKLIAGDYELTVKITGKNLKEEKIRKTLFRIVG